MEKSKKKKISSMLFPKSFKMLALETSLWAREVREVLFRMSQEVCNCKLMRTTGPWDEASKLVTWVDKQWLSIRF